MSRRRLDKFETLPVECHSLVRNAIDSVTERRASQIEAFGILQKALLAKGIPEQSIPTKSSFYRLMERNGPSAFRFVSSQSTPEPPCNNANLPGPLTGNLREGVISRLMGALDGLSVVEAENVTAEALWRVKQQSRFQAGPASQLQRRKAPSK